MFMGGIVQIINDIVILTNISCIKKLKVFNECVCLISTGTQFQTSLPRFEKVLSI